MKAFRKMAMNVCRELPRKWLVNMNLHLNDVYQRALSSSHQQVYQQYAS